MDPIIIFRHIDCEGPGYLGRVLEDRGLPSHMVRVDAGEPVPRQPRASGLVFMGGPMSVNDDLPWVRDELALIEAAAAAGVPLLGHCLGGQLIARALGAEVTANAVKEIGWHEVYAAASAGDNPWLEGLPERFPAFHWHGETFGLPANAQHLFASHRCPHQGFALGNTVLALQFHVEMTAELVREWIERYRQELTTAAGSPAVQTPEAMAADLDARIDALHGVADALYGRWLEAVSP
ncbi:MAG: type 1 glutamine amidotransferase [Gammaproteobacteria bacterium]|nr:type 1 glutamine amidotransferase [Gammaproteobacteria bacterium]